MTISIMTDPDFDAAKAELDLKLNALAPQKVWIKMEHDLIYELNHRGMTGSKEFEFLKRRWTFPTYHNNPVITVFGSDPDLDGGLFKIGESDV